MSTNSELLETSVSELRNKQVQVRIENDDISNVFFGTKLLIGGHSVPELASVSFQHDAGSVAIVRAQVNAINGFAVELPAKVDITVCVFPGFILLEDRTQEGIVKYSVQSET